MKPQVLHLMLASTSNLSLTFGKQRLTSTSSRFKKVECNLKWPEDHWAKVLWPEKQEKCTLHYQLKKVNNTLQLKMPS